MLLIERMKVRAVVLRATLDEYTDDDPKNRESSGTSKLYIVRTSSSG
jgi:hypothetical protein